MLPQILRNAINCRVIFKETAHISEHMLDFSLFQVLESLVFLEMTSLTWFFRASKNCCNIYYNIYSVDTSIRKSYFYWGLMKIIKSWIHEIPTRKILDPRNTHEKKFETHKISMRKNVGPTKYPREKIWDPKYPPEKILDPRNIHEKNLAPTKYPPEQIWNPWIIHDKKIETHKIPTRKYFGPTKNLNWNSQSNWTLT